MTIDPEVYAALHASAPVNTLGSRMGEMFDEARVAWLVRKDCARRPFALVLIGAGGAVTMVHMFATKEERASAAPILRTHVNHGFVPMDSLEAMERSDSFIRGCLAQ
jgi:hypothetical protein